MQDKVSELARTLRQYDLQELDEALARVRDGEPAPQPKIGEIEPGESLAVGEDCHVEMHELGFAERIILPENNLLQAHFLTEGALVQRAVAKVTVNPPGWSGTGFMVSRSLFLTNNHVIRNTTDAANARMRFNYQYDHDGNDQAIDEYQADPASFFHTNAALDYTLVRLKPKLPVFAREAMLSAAVAETNHPSIDPSVLHRIDPNLINRGIFDPTWFRVHAGTKWGHLRIPTSAAFASGQRLNVVQHPRGRRKEVAIQANRVTSVFTNVVRYTTDTEPGSSGSPVLNNGWDLVALHHAAGSQDSNGNWLDNEGIRADRIASDLQSALGGSTAGQAVLNELGL